MPTLGTILPVLFVMALFLNIRASFKLGLDWRGMLTTVTELAAQAGSKLDLTDERAAGTAQAFTCSAVLTGPPLRIQEVSRERITPAEGLSALSLDALSSVAYGPEAILAVLAAAGAAALHLVLPITVLIVALLIVWYALK